VSFDGAVNGLTRRLFMGQDPPWPGQFVFMVDGVTIGHFHEVSGLSVRIEEEKIVEGGQNEFTHRVPGRMTWPNLVLKRGVTSNDALFSWLKRCSGEGFSGKGNKVERHTAHLVLLGPTMVGIGPAKIREPIRAWSFYDAFPVSWSGPTMSTSASEVATETLEVAHHGFRSELPSLPI